MRIIAMLILLTISTSSFAQDTVGVTKGSLVPYTGVLMSFKRAEKAMKAEKANIVLKDLRIAEKELTEYHRDAARAARAEVTKVQVKSYMNVIGAFILGVVVTGFAAKMNNKIQEI